jgi:hypothetical protein
MVVGTAGLQVWLMNVLVFLVCTSTQDRSTSKLHLMVFGGWSIDRGSGVSVLPMRSDSGLHRKYRVYLLCFQENLAINSHGFGYLIPFLSQHIVLNFAYEASFSHDIQILLFENVVLIVLNSLVKVVMYG